MTDNTYFDDLKKIFFELNGYSSAKDVLCFPGKKIIFDLNTICDMNAFFKCIGEFFPLDPELSDKSIEKKSWDALNDSLSNGMIDIAESGNICYVVKGFEKFSCKYNESWDLIFILYESKKYIEDNGIDGNVNIFILK